MDKLISDIFETINIMEDNGSVKVDGCNIIIHSDINGNITSSASLFNEIVKLNNKEI